MTLAGYNLQDNVYIYSNNKCMCVFLISPVPIAEPLTSELIDTPVFYNLAPRPIKYRVSVPIPTCHTAPANHKRRSQENMSMLEITAALHIYSISSYFPCMNMHKLSITIPENLTESYFLWSENKYKFNNTIKRVLIMKPILRSRLT